MALSLAAASRRRRHSRGFTLIEVMLVVVIIGILSSVAIPGMRLMSARAMRSESKAILSKMRLYWMNQYENAGQFVQPGDMPTTLSAWNPPSPPGQPDSWVPSAPGWRDFPFPPEGAIKMRYQFSIDSPQQMTFYVTGNFPGVGFYQYSETYQGTSISSTFEVPQF